MNRLVTAGPTVDSSWRAPAMIASASTEGTDPVGRPVAAAKASDAAASCSRRLSVSPDSWTAIASTAATAAAPSRSRIRMKATTVIVSASPRPTPRPRSQRWNARLRIAASAENASVASRPWSAWT